MIIECETVPPPDEGTDDKGDKKDAKKTGAFGDQIITAEFVDTDIRVIIEALVAQSGANIMLQPGVSGNYSLSLKDVTLTQALDALWEAWGLVWMELPGNIYLVGTEANLGDRRADVLSRRTGPSSRARCCRGRTRARR